MAAFSTTGTTNSISCCRLHRVSQNEGGRRRRRAFVTLKRPRMARGNGEGRREEDEGKQDEKKPGNRGAPCLRNRTCQIVGIVGPAASWHLVKHPSLLRLLSSVWLFLVLFLQIARSSLLATRFFFHRIRKRFTHFYNQDRNICYKQHTFWRVP